jgi:PAS domain S-box-containing protein
MFWLLGFVPDWLENAGKEVGDIWPILVIVAGAAGIVYRLTKRSFKNVMHDFVQEEIKPLQQQFENNGGSSMRDAIDNIDKTMTTHTESDASNFKHIAEVLDRIVNTTQINEAKVAALTATASTAYFEADANGNLQHVNYGWTELTGLTQNDSIGFGWLKAIQADEREGVALSWRASIAGQYMLTGTVHFEGVDGEVYLSVRPIADTSGELLGWIGAAVPVD